jgi:hypothetical protein
LFVKWSNLNWILHPQQPRLLLGFLAAIKIVKKLAGALNVKEVEVERV